MIVVCFQAIARGRFPGWMRWNDGIGKRRMKLPAIALLAVLAFPALAGDITGLASVIDGDTLDVAGVRVRLSGIDAPESKQVCGDWPCGAAATSHMREIAAGVVECAPEGSDRYGRVIAVCYAGGVDLGGEMVRRGLALAYRRYSDRYVPQENAAREEKAGMWGSTFVAPWVWRHDSAAKSTR